VNRARKLAMLACAICVTPIVFASGVTSMWLAAALVGLAAAAHRAGRRTCSRWCPTSSRGPPSRRWSASAAWPARLAEC
jgi:ACS family hexuronate transporter-like MFS transporter